MTLAPGTRLGPYEVIAAIGAGGMGEVYRAKDTRLNRDVALKILPEALAADPDRLARFRREAQVLASLNHPNIGHIYGFEDTGSTQALVLELVEGPTLADRIAAGPIAPTEALPIARQIAEALDAAHAQAIVHRDLKPANIKVRGDGAVKVLDFGLARALDPAAASSATTSALNSPTMTSPAMTLMGVILGTAAYMSPEQARAQPVDKRADIWAFGVVLYEMLTGRQCFEGETVSDVLAAVLRADIDWNALPADTPRGVRRLLGRCLERDPRRRLRDIGDAWTDLALEPFDETGAGSSPAAIRRPSLVARWLPWAVAMVGIGAAIAWAALPTPPPPARIVTRAQVTFKDRVGRVAISRDGTQLAYTMAIRTNGAANPSPSFLMLRRLDEVDARQIPGTEGAVSPVFSPDGRWIAYTELPQGTNPGLPIQVRKILVTGGASIYICDGEGFGRGGAWGDDDTIVFGSAKGLVRVSAAGGTPQPLTLVDSSKGEKAHSHPQFLSGGRQLLFTITPVNSTDLPQIAVLDLSTGRYRTVAKVGGNARYVASGHLTYVRGGTLFAVPFDVRRLAVTGDEVPVVEGVDVRGGPLAGDYSVSDAGLLVYVMNNSSAGGPSTLAWIDRAGTTQPLPGDSRQHWGSGRLSPDGSRIADAIYNADGSSDIWMFDVQRGTRTRLTSSGKADNPIWTPDGSRIVYAQDPGLKGELYSLPADGSGKPDLLIAAGQPAMPTSFTLNGKTLLYQSGPGSALYRIFELPLTASGSIAGPSHQLHQAAAAEWDAQVSPDGRWIAYLSNESGQSDVYVQKSPGAGVKWHVSTQGCVGARWARSVPDELIYRCGPPNWPFMAVDMPADPKLGPGAPRELFRLHSGGTWDVTPDRNRLLVEPVPDSDRSATTMTIETVTDWFEELRRLAPPKK